MRTRPYVEVNPNHSDPTIRRIDYVFKSTRPDIYGPDTSSTSTADLNSPKWYYRYESGSRNDGWRDAIRRKANANSFLHLNITDYSGETGSAYARVRKAISGGWYQYEKLVPYGLTYVREPAEPNHSALYDKALDEAKQRLVSRIREVQTAFQGGVYLGESRETIRMLTGGVTAIDEAIGDWAESVPEKCRRAVRNVPLAKRLVKVSSTLANLWLGLQYGIRPLISDVQSAAEALARLDIEGQMGDCVIVRAVSSQRSSNIVDVGTGGEQWTNSDIASGGSPTIPIRWRLRDDKECRVSLRAMVKANRIGAGGVMQYLGLNLQDFVPTIYELIPYSMILDYFTNCGKIVDASSLRLADVDWCWRTRKDSTRRTFDAYDLKPDQFHSTYSTYYERELRFLVSPQANYRRVKVTRENNGLNLVPGLSFRIPGVKDWQKWLNMTALVRKTKAAERSLQKLVQLPFFR